MKFVGAIIMRVEVFQPIPQQAIEIRQKVFVEEQGFQNEFDDIDLIAMHFVLFDDLDIPIATCRVFKDVKESTYILGRLAVTKENRGKSIGSLIVKRAEVYVKKMGGDQLQLHAQCRIVDFYNKLGFSAFGEVEDDEGCPHIWMRKRL
ncbi:MAG: GNAT family N-acetyltransferase [Acutalibacteraceae bacterium]|nr:GNAT family N-acetyltransferase [Acutalibacteraceae bacterium]